MQVVYALTNKCMPGLVKIGEACSFDHFKQRPKQLFTTGVPEPFDVAAYIEVVNSKGVEARVHDTFSEYRVSSGREFFRVEIEDVLKVFGKFAEIKSFSVGAESKKRRQVNRKPPLPSSDTDDTPIVFTEAKLRQLDKKPPASRTEYKIHKGFPLLLRHGGGTRGKMTWILRINQGGKMVTKTIGRWPAMTLYDAKGVALRAMK